MSGRRRHCRPRPAQPSTTTNAGSAAFPAARQPPDRGQRRHRQDLHHRRAVRAPGAGPWRARTPCHAADAAAKSSSSPSPRRRPRSCATASAPVWPKRPPVSVPTRPRQRARPPAEDLLHDAAPEYPPEQWPACARKLQLAAEAMDEAAVSTIHGWCKRMLREHASTATACSPRPWKPTSASCSPKSCATTGAASWYPLDPRRLPSAAMVVSPEALRASLQASSHTRICCPRPLPPAGAREAAREEAAARWPSSRRRGRNGWMNLQTLLDAARRQARQWTAASSGALLQAVAGALQAWRDDPEQVVAPGSRPAGRA
jgi:hypothetical protein